jgi:hypothetical protein
MLEHGTLRARRYSFIQNAIDGPALESLPAVSILGERVAATPALSKVWLSGVIPEQVDLVYTWVDGQHPEWIDRRARALADTGPGILTNDAAIVSRYHNRDEILYSVRSALSYFRGIRNLYIVTDQQTPALKQHPRITLVDHREIFKKKSDLPTFNSHAIESQLHRIPGLLDRFIYMNDDVFFGRAVTPFLFFDEYGRSRYFVSQSVTIPDGPPDEADAGVDVAAKNAQALLNKEFGAWVTRKFKHTPIALDRRVIAEMESRFPEAFATTASARFRSTRDLAISGSLYFHYAALTGRAVEGAIKYGYFDLNSEDFPERFRIATLESDRYDAFCVNDNKNGPHTARNEPIFDEAMRSHFPSEVEGHAEW